MYYLSYVFILLSCVNARYLQVPKLANFSDITYPVKPLQPFINFDDIPISDTPVPTPTPLEPIIIPTSDTPVPTPTPVEPISDTPVPTPVEPIPTEIIINPTPPSIDPSITKQLKSIYRICVGTFVMLLLFFLTGLGIVCKLCLNRY